jgi:hypothetical protein
MSAGAMKPGPKATGGRGKIARGTVEEVADGSSRGSEDRVAHVAEQRAGCGRRQRLRPQRGRREELRSFLSVCFPWPTFRSALLSSCKR